MWTEKGMGIASGWAMEVELYKEVFSVEPSWFSVVEFRIESCLVLFASKTSALKKNQIGIALRAHHPWYCSDCVILFV